MLLTPRPSIINGVPTVETHVAKLFTPKSIAKQSLELRLTSCLCCIKTKFALKQQPVQKI